MKSISFFILVSIVFNLGFTVKEANCIRQGIKGNVYRLSGNQMPSPDLPTPQPKGIKVTLAVFELTNTSQVKTTGQFYESISTRLVELIRTDEKGAFKVKLKPGMYSLFIKKDSLFYSNVFDDKFNIHPVEVKKGKWTVDNLKVDYDAVY